MSKSTINGFVYNSTETKIIKNDSVLTYNWTYEEFKAYLEKCVIKYNFCCPLYLEQYKFFPEGQVLSKLVYDTILKEKTPIAVMNTLSNLEYPYILNKPEDNALFIRLHNIGGRPKEKKNKDV